MAFTKATKRQSRLRMALGGPAGSGKTYTGLRLACALVAGTNGRVATIDTERGSASKYSDLFDFDVLELDSFHPQRYIDAIHEAGQAGYGALLIDSLSHAWMGVDGALQLVDNAKARSQSGNGFAAWRDVTPLHNALVDAMLGAPLHLIATMRTKTEYVQEKDDKGRTVVRRVGLKPEQRDGMEYEFDVYGDLDHENRLIVGKTRCSALAGAVIPKPGDALAETLLTWLTAGEPEVPRTCAACDKPITALNVGDRSFTAAQWATETERLYGKPLCLEHFKAARDAKKAQPVAAGASQ